MIRRICFVISGCALLIDESFKGNNMKTQTDSILPTYQVLGQVLRINFDQQEVTQNDMQGNPHTSYEYTTAISEPSATRAMLIEAVIGSRYSPADETAIINNQVSNPIDYADYQFFRVQAKAMADSWLAKTSYIPPTRPLEEERIASLWQAAHDYEYAAISGSAIGLVTLGLLQAKPKCQAVENWIKSIWEAYYARKAGASTDCDFATVAGPCPYSVPDLMVELGV